MRLLAVVLLAASLGSQALAQSVPIEPEQVAPVGLPNELSSTADVGSKASPSERRKLASQAKAPDYSTTPNRVISDLKAPPMFGSASNVPEAGESTSPIASILLGISFEAKSFEVEDKKSTQGFAWTYRRDIGTKALSNERGALVALRIGVQSEGNVAFDEEANPKDFLDSEISLLLLTSLGGTLQEFSAAQQVECRKLDLELARFKPRSQDQAREEFFSSDTYKKASQIVLSNLSDQLYFHISLNPGLEANQRFTARQFTFGPRLVMTGALHRHAHLNFFDYPFAVLRRLLGFGELSPLPFSIPSVALGIDRVFPQADDARAKSGDKSAFWRVSVDVSFRTPFARASTALFEEIGIDSELTLYFDFRFRYWKELSARSSTKRAKLDDAYLITLGIGSSIGVFVSFSSGRLPFDGTRDDFGELGWRFNF